MKLCMKLGKINDAKIEKAKISSRKHTELLNVSLLPSALLGTNRTKNTFYTLGKLSIL